MTQPTPPWLDERLAPDGQAVRANFERWFEQSKVVDPDIAAAPLRVFHGTTNEFEAFDMRRGNIENSLGPVSISQATRWTPRSTTPPSTGRTSSTRSRTSRRRFSKLLKMPGTTRSMTSPTKG